MIQPTYPVKGGQSVAYKNAYVGAYLTSPPTNPGENAELLAVELFVKRRHVYDNIGNDRLEKSEECFFKLFGDTSYGNSPDVIMGESRSDPRCNPIKSADQTLWDIKRHHMVSFCATVDTPKKCFPDGTKTQAHYGRFDRYNIASDDQALLDAWLDGEKVVAKWTQGSSWDRIIARHHHLIGKGKPECIYLVGTDPNKAKEQLFAKLVAQQVPALPEWEEALWAEFQRAGWVVSLGGTGWQGFKLSVNRDQVLELICSLVKARALPRPYDVPEEIWEVV